MRFDSASDDRIIEEQARLIPLLSKEGEKLSFRSRQLKEL